MTPRERILTAFHHQVPDRPPTDAWFHDEVIARLKKHYRTDSWDRVLQELGIEGWAHYSLNPRIAEFDRVAVRRTYKGMTRTGIWTDDRTYKDQWGVVSRIGETGWYEEWVGGPLVDADGSDLGPVRDLVLPAVDQSALPRECEGSFERYAARIAAMKQRGLFVNGGISNPYKTAWQLRGMDNVLADYLINREFLEALYDRLYAFYGEMARRMTRAGVDMISVTGDIAMQDRIIMGPETWREVDKPRMARLVADCRRENPDVFMFIHSDGNVTDVMDDLVEIGFNVVNPIQPECMDPVEVKRKWGDRIVIHGGISLQRALVHGTPADVRVEVEDLIRQCGYNGGLVVFPSNVIQPDSPTENVIACFHAARDFK
jgi:uroporphyrinogen decarboxylase